MDVNFEDCLEIELRFTDSDEDGNKLGFGRLEDDKVLVVTISEDGSGVASVISYGQAYSLVGALERLENGVDEEAKISIATDGFTETKNDSE